MNKKIISLLAILLCLVTFSVSSFAFSNELNEKHELLTLPEKITDANGNAVEDLSITYRGIIDKQTVKDDVSVFLMIRNIKSGESFSVGLYNRNNYIALTEIPEPGYYEIYSAFYALEKGMPSSLFPVEYVMFYHPGDRPVSVNIIFGEPKNLDISNIGDTFRVNKPGEQYKDYPTNIASKNVNYEEYNKYGDVPLDENREKATEPDTTKNFLIDDFFEGSTIDKNNGEGSNEFEYNEESKLKGIITLMAAIGILAFGVFYYFKKIKK